jgi:NAD(P)-dependent dehydrogenase (short-subunit alcohol dehydrogenase family)
MEGRICLVTGGTSGVGLAVARGLALQGATLILLSRNQENGSRVKEQLSVQTDNPRIGLVPADLSDEGSVRNAAASVERVHKKLHVVACCAGVLYPQRATSSRGLELTFATEVYGHFRLLSLLLDRLKASAPARVVVAAGSPGPLRSARVHFDDPQLESGYNPLRAKMQAAVAKVLLVQELARRLDGTGVTANVFHPGLVRSNLVRHLPGVLRLPAHLGLRLFGKECPTGVNAASSDALDSVSGQFLVRKRIGKFPDRREEAARLWEYLESLTRTG